MKKILILITVFLFFWLIYSCKEELVNKPLFNDNTKPSPVSDVKVVNTEGGAIITYKLADDPSILYVKAEYQINETTSRTEKSSYYSDTVRVEGFAKEGAYKVTLRTVSRNEIASDPIEVTVNPLTPPYLSIAKSLELLPDFGGINIAYKNPKESEVGIVILTDSLNAYEYLDTKYVKDSKGNFSIRGLASREKTFGAYVRDRWGNVSDTVFVKTTPYNEIELDRSKMSTLSLPGDIVGCCGSSPSVPLTANGAADWALYGEATAATKLPSRITYDLGRTVKMSRFKLWIRVNGIAEYINGTPKMFRIYGSNNPNPDGSLDESWMPLGDIYELVKPSGLPYGKRNAEDDAAKYNGFEFVLPLPAKSIRYWRFVLISNFAQGNSMDIAALKFWGDPQ